ncbi:MAG: hypothetical protein ACI4JM_12370 [Oscillospiraceae bacterium]
MSNLVFLYAVCSNKAGIPGISDFHEWSFSIYENGQCLYIRYLFGEKEKYRRYMSVSDITLKNIRKIIKRYEIQIDLLKNADIDNDYYNSMSINKFMFYDTEIKCSFRDDDKKQNTKNVISDKTVMDYENTIRQIFSEICFQLERDGIKMDIHKFSRKVLFSYSCFSGEDEEYGTDCNEWEFRIYEDGRCAYIKYLFGEIENYRRNVFISKDTLEKVRSIILNYKPQIDFLKNAEIDNGSCDGELNIFEFHDSRIVCRNIEYVDVRKIKNENEKYFLEYEDNIVYENTLIQIFTEICSALETDGIEMNLHKFRRKPKLFI